MTTSILVDHVSKHFSLKHVHSLKESAARAIRGKRDQIDSFTALSDVSLDIQTGDTVALIGLNGSGKSTLLKCISGVLRPDSGNIGVRGRVAGLIEVGAGFHPDLTGRENIFLNAAILA